MLGDPAYTFRRHYVDRFLLVQGRNFANRNAMVLDLGGRRQRRRGQFDPVQLEGTLITANIVPEGGVDVVTDAQYSAFGDGIFDVVVCSEVLEHLYRPQAAVHEINRILKPTGVLIATVPFLFPVHGDPEDFGRYTQEYWRRTLTEAGFDMGATKIEAQGGFASSLAQLVLFGLRCLTSVKPGFKSRFAALMLRIAPPVLRRVPKWDERTDKAGLTGFPSGFGIIAFKPAERKSLS